MREQVRKDTAAVGFLLLLTSVFWGRFLFGGQLFYARDLGFFFAPLRQAFAECLRQGAPPLWNAYLGGGIPLSADPNNAVFFAPTLLFWIRPLSAAVRATYLLWIFAFPLSSYAGLRGLRASPFSAAVGAGAISICGPAMTLSSFPHVAWASMLFLPVVALARAGTEGKSRSAVMAGILFGVSILVGEPVIALHLLFAAAVFSLARDWPASVRASAVVAAVGTLVALPQILQALQLLPETARGSGLPLQFGAAFNSVRPERLAGFLWPGLFGDVNSPVAWGFWGKDFFDAGTPYLSSLAVGTVALALLPAAARDPRGRRFLLFAGVAALLSFGRYLPGGGFLLRLPGLSLLRYPEKWLFFASFAVLAAGAFGLDRIAAGDDAARRRVVRAGAGLAILSGAAAALLLVSPRALLEALSKLRIVSPQFSAAGPLIARAILGDVLQVGAFALLACLVLLWRGGEPRGRRAPLFLAGLLFLELFPRTWNSVPLTDAPFFDSAPPAVRAVKARGGRLYFGEEAEIAPDPLRPMAPVEWGVAFAGNNDIDRFSPRRSFFFGLELSRLSFADPRKVRLLRLADVRSISTIDPAASSCPALLPLLKTSASRTVFALSSGGRFRLVFRTRPAADESGALREVLASDFDPEREAVVEGAPGAFAGEGTGRIELVKRRPDQETVLVESPTSAFLVRSETYDAHWRAAADGRPVRVFPADFAFQGVFVPAGRHVVKFRYVDRAVAAGMVLSLLTLAVCAIALTRPSSGGRGEAKARGLTADPSPRILSARRRPGP